jgi:hypothetical protein
MVWPARGNGLAWLAVYFSRDLIYTTGTIIRLERTSIRHRNTMSRVPVMIPVVRFPLGKGTLVVHGLGGSGTTSYTVGDKVPIAYRKSDPETAHIRTFEQEFAIPLVMIVFASPFLLIGFRLAYVNVRDRRRR